MKSIKTMLLGIASLIIAVCTLPLFAIGMVFGAVAFFVFLIIGVFLCIDGFLTPHE